MHLVVISRRIKNLIDNYRSSKNVFGDELCACCRSPMTGYYRDGYCKTEEGDFGAHVVCAQVNFEFLEFTKSKGNDLSTPLPEYNFPGLRPGDSWCLCALRFKQAIESGIFLPINLDATHIRTLETFSLEELREYQVN